MSDYALLVNLTTNEVIYEKNAYERTYPASLTKMMTVLVGIEHMKDEEIVYRCRLSGIGSRGSCDCRVF